jgi:hypothetical protein
MSANPTPSWQTSSQLFGQRLSDFVCAGPTRSHLVQSSFRSERSKTGNFTAKHVSNLATHDFHLESGEFQKGKINIVNQGDVLPRIDWH